MKRGDIWLIGIITIALSVVSILFIQDKIAADSYEGKIYARITIDREHYKTIELTEQEQMIELQTKRGSNVLRIADGGIQMIDADCPDDLCMLMGYKNKIGETIVCLPNRVLVEIIGEHGEEAEIDALAN